MGGAACPPELLAESAARGVRALATYGMTEMCSQVATQAPTREPVAQRGVGRALHGVELRLVDEDGAPVATGAVGRITVRGPMRMRGYWGLPPLADEAWFDTGDLGALDEAGVGGGGRRGRVARGALATRDVPARGLQATEAAGEGGRDRRAAERQARPGRSAHALWSVGLTVGDGVSSRA
nr:AMP-binding protein [Deltaproteobacteria bacterium]